jgi:predicted nucleotidyltransferase
MDIEEVKKIIRPILKEYGVSRASVFGSVARGEDGPDSDVDILVKVTRPFSLVGVVSLKHRMESALNRPVDVVEYEAIKPSFAENILKDAKLIYER